MSDDALSDHDGYRNVEEFLDDQAPRPQAIHKAKDLFKATESVTEALLAIVMVYEGLADEEDDGPAHLYKAIEKFAKWEMTQI